MSTTAEEALLRAKAIAARLSGNAATDTASPPSTVSPTSSTTATTLSTKRKRWGVAPAVVNAGQEALPGLADATKKAKVDNRAKQDSSKKIWVRTCGERGVAHFKAYFATRLQDLENEINSGKSSDDSETVKLELKGRGSSDKPALPGIPEEPMHILITGSDSAIAAAEPQVDTSLTEAEQAPAEAVDPEQVNSGKALTNDYTVDNSMALTTIGSRFNSNSAYRPASVAQLISNNPIHSAMNSGDLMEETVDVPNGVVGFLIGRGGETISSMQARSGCKIQIQKEHDLVPGQTNRVITLQAATQESIDQCRGMIEGMVQDRIRAAGGSSTTGSKDVKVQDALAAGHALVQVDVPDADVGLIIGKAGATIKAIQDQTGAQVQIPPSGSSDQPEMRTVSITHPTEEGAHMAKRRIEELLSSKPSFTQDRRPSTGPQITVQVMVSRCVNINRLILRVWFSHVLKQLEQIPDRDVGLCIGRQGCVIKEMQQKTGTRIQIPSQPTPGQAHRVATVTGTQEGCNQVQGFIERIINEQSSACVMSGAPPQQNYYQEQLQGANQNSAEWQAYYAAQAVVKQQQPPVQAPAAPVPAADAYYEQFFRYAYYYGEPAARQYYGAWSPPVGTPNPYGVNPNGVTAAPAAAPTPAAAAPAVAPMSHQESRESSVRKVSNLPAWMTQGT